MLCYSYTCMRLVFVVSCWRLWCTFDMFTEMPLFCACLFDSCTDVILFLSCGDEEANPEQFSV